MSIDPGWIMWELVLGGVGFVLFTYGRKQARIPQLVTGLLFMIYPMFVSGLPALLGVAGLLALALWIAIRLGW